jgi:hypothetical protein
MEGTAPYARRWWALRLKRPALAFVGVCLAVGVVLWAPAATASAHLDLTRTGRDLDGSADQEETNNA